MTPRARSHTARLRCYAELNDFLPARLRQREFEHTFDGSPAVKDLVESLGVPHAEIDLLLVNGVSVGFDHRVRDGDRIAVYPVFEALDVSPLQHLRPTPLRETRFVLDAHLGRLARWLRILGFDAACRPGTPDDELIACSLSEGRIILTRDRELLKARELTHGCWVRATDPRRQVLEVLDRFDLRAQARPFTRCSLCNGELAPAEATEAAAEAPPRVRERCREFFRCTGCRRLYWKGTHLTRLEAFVAWALEPGRGADGPGPGPARGPDHAPAQDALTNPGRPGSVQ